jgi:IclR family transcriptional regulator, acetate operon repressor
VQYQRVPELDQLQPRVPRQPDPLATLSRGLEILEALASASPTRGLDHAALARRLGCGRSTLYRYLARLQDSGFVEEGEGQGRYRLGPRILYLAAVMHERDFSELAREHVRSLATETGETAHATVYDHPYSVTVLIAESSAPVGPRVQLGSRRPLHTSASGKVFLAHADRAKADAYLATRLEARTPVTITAPAALRRLMTEVRAKGYAIDEGESYEEICGVAAPVFDFAGDVIGTLSITSVGARLEADFLARLVEPLRRNAQALSARLGNVEALNAGLA